MFKKLFKGVGIIFVLLLVLGLVFGNDSKDSTGEGTAENNKSVTEESVEQKNDSSAEEEEAAEPKSDYSVEGEITAGADSLGYPNFTGIVKNNTDSDKSYVSIEFTLYDAEGNVIGSAIDNMNNLKAGGTWKFKAIGFDSVAEEYTRYEYEISGW